MKLYREVRQGTRNMQPGGSSTSSSSDSSEYRVMSRAWPCVSAMMKKVRGLPARERLRPGVPRQSQWAARIRQVLTK